jgi:predicted nucleic acid-binding protein
MSTDLPILFDTDTISSFAWVNRLDILETLYSEKMFVLPEIIYEISNVKHLKEKLESCIEKKAISIVYLDPLGEDGQEFARLRGLKKFGYGEAAAMAYAKNKEVILASNNLRDVLTYCAKYKIPLISTRRIMYEAVKDNVLDMEEAETIWKEMIKRRRKLPCKTFKEAFDFYEDGEGKNLTIHKY